MNKIDGLEELWIWVLNTDSCICHNQALMFQPQTINHVYDLVSKVSEAISDENPYYANELPKIAKNLFPLMGGFYSVNTAAFGELYIITKHLHDEPQNTSLWTMIHPRIVAIAKDEFLDGHFASAAHRSCVELETRLRELFKELKPGSTVPSRTSDLIGALLTENGAYHFCDTSTPSGKDYRRGIQSLFEGFIAAYRNPSSHENQNLSKTDAFEQIVLASQLMKVLDKE